jgi:hypothetical protein
MMLLVHPASCILHPASCILHPASFDFHEAGHSFLSIPGCRAGGRIEHPASSIQHQQT